MDTYRVPKWEHIVPIVKRLRRKFKIKNDSKTIEQALLYTYHELIENEREIPDRLA